MSVSIADEIPSVNHPAELDTVLGHLRRQFHPELVLDGPPVRLGGGFWAEMYLIELSDPTAELEGRLVARIMPDPATAACARAATSSRSGAKAASAR